MTFKDYDICTNCKRLLWIDDQAQKYGLIAMNNDWKEHNDKMVCSNVCIIQMDKKKKKEFSYPVEW
jgi:hypothetical protein